MAKSKKEYSVKKTVVKVLRELLIWGVPQAVTLVAGTGVGKMSVAALVSVCGRVVLDYLKHRQ